jgi:nitric oxide reductase NorD protein
MALQLSDYQEILDQFDETTLEVLTANWQEATRVFTPRGLDTYLRGAAGLKSLGRGGDLVSAFLDAAPQVAKEIGEQAMGELLSSAIQMYSKTSASVIELLFSTAPTAAARLGELELFKGYLSLLNHLLAQAPRAIRPLLEHLEVLLTHLTLGGLRRWAMWGVSAYRNDFAGQADYFGLKNESSLTVLKKEQRGVLFVDVQRRLIMYLRALWGRDFFLRPTSGDFETRTGYRPYIEANFIHLPDAFDDFASPDGISVKGVDIYRAAAAHSAAHIVYSRYYHDAQGLTPLQQLFVGMIEDARVEHLALKDFPGLLPLWQNLLAVTPDDDSTASLLGRMARALIDINYHDSHPLVVAAAALFRQHSDRYKEQELALELGLQLAEQAAALNLSYNPRQDTLNTPYRDDNRYLWQAPEDAENTILLPGQAQQVRKYVSVMEMVMGLDVEYAGDDAQEVWILETPFFEDDGTTINEKEGKEPVASPVHYAEWDYQTQLERPQWVTVLEKRPKRGDAGLIEQAIEKHKPIIQRLKRLIEAAQPQGVIRQRNVEDGDTIDLNAAIQAMVDIRMGRQPNPRIGIRTRLQIRDLSVLLLIDLSESTNDQARGAEEGVKVIDLAREAAALLAEALHKVGDPYAIHGFDSNGRHDVEYFRFKDFDAPYNDATKEHLAAMSGKLSTRMGAALRHAGHLLNQRPSQKKLILLLTDGEPADNDVRDPQYLRHDTKRAVEELARSGVRTFCMTLDPQADQYVERIFGAKHYLVLDNILRLPEKLPALYLGMTR